MLLPLPPPRPQNFPLIRDESLPLLRGKFAVIKLVNLEVVEMMALLDTCPEEFLQDLDARMSRSRAGRTGQHAGPLPPSAWCLGSRFRRMKRLFFMVSKMSAMETLLRARYNIVPAHEGGIHELVLDRMKANSAHDVCRVAVVRTTVVLTAVFVCCVQTLAAIVQEKSSDDAVDTRITPGMQRTSTW